MGRYVHAEKIHRELTVDIVEFIFIFAVIRFQSFLIQLFEVVEIVGAFGIDALMDDKVFAVFLGNQSISTVRTTQFHRGEATFIWGEPCSTDFTEKLSLGTIVFVQEGLGCITAGASAVIRNVAF